MKIISILGSTGSIGTQTLDVIRTHADKFEIYGLSANNNKNFFLATFTSSGSSNKQNKIKIVAPLFLSLIIKIESAGKRIPNKDSNAGTLKSGK